MPRPKKVNVELEQDDNKEVDEIRVAARQWYTNGTLLDKPWSRGEIRVITKDLLKRIEADLPGNWEVLNA